MGYGRDSLNLTLSLWKDRLFNDFESVVELGSQDLKVPNEELNLVFKNVLGISSSTSKGYTPADFYKGLGFKSYSCIDADGQHNALVFDLNKDICSAYDFHEQFNLVTNHGTSEHCFDQANVFRNVHNLCEPGGIMIHGLPFQGYLNHGFFNYQPAFYRTLASANNYKLIGLYLNIDSEAGDISTFSEAMMSHLILTPKSMMLLLAVFQKNDNREFCLPFDGKYSSSSLLGDPGYTFAKTPSSFFIPNQFDVIHSTPSNQLTEILKTRLVSKLKRVCRHFMSWKK